MHMVREGKKSTQEPLIIPGPYLRNQKNRYECNFFLSIYCLCVWLHVCMCTTLGKYLQGPEEGPGRLDLEVQMVVGESQQEQPSPLNSWATAPALNAMFFTILHFE